MKYIITEDRSKKVAFRFFKEMVGDIRPFDKMDNGTHWIGYTNDFCEQNDTFLFGIIESESNEKPLGVYYWGTAFDMDTMAQLFGYDLARSYLKEYIQQYYDEPIRIF